MTLQQQLEYFWERGFYSVIEDDRYQIRLVTTKSYQEHFYITAGCDSVDLAKRQIGFSHSSLGVIDGDKSKWKVVDTILPSELMGKGFQVGDRVVINRKGNSAHGEEVEVRFFDSQNLNYQVLTSVGYQWLPREQLKPVQPTEERGVDMVGNKTKDPVSLEDTLVEDSTNVDFDSGKPEARVGYLNGKYITIDERDIKPRSHICNCGFWDSEKKWGETVYTQQFGDRCVSMSVTNNYVVCSTCGQKLRRIAISYLDTYE